MKIDYYYYYYFRPKFGTIFHDMCNSGKLSYHREIERHSKEIKGYSVDHLTEQELYNLMKKICRDGCRPFIRSREG